MSTDTGRHLRLTAGVAALVLLLTGCGATAQQPQAETTSTAAPSPEPTRTASPEPEPEPSPEPDQPPEVELALDRSKPVKLSIPKLDVDSELIETGLRDDGTLEVPPGDEGSPASWYTGSPTPGSAGPSVLLGHVNSLSDPSGIFYRIRELAAGDRVTVTREDGSTAIFEVYRNESFVKDQFPTKEVYFPVRGAELRMITCDAYVASARLYENNRVVFAKLVETA
ncbi:class F sortase [Lysobacter korlensis]|uniref:Class F sortase n=1 Tax=Lysobacter korlensis TaxID=553636 RepID=A0ABV6RMS6_9GAMM